MKNDELEIFLSNTIREQLIVEAERRLVHEGLNRIEKSLDMLSEEEIWWRPNDQSNSVGNLLLHLGGNVRQWILAGLGGHEDIRERDKEFTEKGPISKEMLLNQLEEVLNETIVFLKKLTSADLVKKYSVQGFQESGVSILIHVIEHFSYHVGQITYFVKSRKNIDTGYYSGIDLTKKSK
jgi:uncharacterized damage-inducible protein DinB